MNIGLKLKLAARLKEELDGHVWEVFSKYCKVKSINFNSPDGWVTDGYSVDFHGQDGCRGCYDNMSLSIPIEFFTETDDSFARLEAEIEDQKRKREEEVRIQKEEIDRKRYEELHKRFGKEK